MRLGTKKNPARVRVATEKEARDILYVCTAKGWQVIVEINPDEPEEISDLLRLQDPAGFHPAEKRPLAPPPTFVNRNELCPCGSGRKYKNCCCKD